LFVGATKFELFGRQPWKYRRHFLIGGNGSGTYYGYYPVEKSFFAADEF